MHYDNAGHCNAAPLLSTVLLLSVLNIQDNETVTKQQRTKQIAYNSNTTTGRYIAAILVDPFPSS